MYLAIYLNSEGISENFEELFISIFWIFLKNGTKGAFCEEKRLLKRILHSTYSWNLLLPNIRMDTFEESGIIMFFVLSAVKELL